LKASVNKAALYTLIGHPEKIPDHNWDNTCAIRVSVALVGIGFPIAPGYLAIESGPHKGRRIESRQRVLSELLRRRWGEPLKFSSGPEARKALAGHRGVISFFHLNGPTDQQGHIDLVAPNEWNEAICADDCYWQSVEVWFWPLK
jgi:hypothetical protein